MARNSGGITWRETKVAEAEEGAPPPGAEEGAPPPGAEEGESAGPLLWRVAKED